MNPASPLGSRYRDDNADVGGTRLAAIDKTTGSIHVSDPKPYRRRQAVRHLLHPRRVTDSVRLARQPSFRNSALAGLQAGATAAIALPLVWLSPWSHLIGFAALGALVALFGRFAPRQSRNRILFFCALCQAAAVFSMSLVVWLGAPTSVQLGLLAVGCGAFLFIGLTGGFGPPGPLIFVFAAAASMSSGLTLGQVAERTAATAIIAALAWVICASSEVFRHAPTADRRFPPDPQPPVSHRLKMATRATIGAAIAVFVSHGLGANHPAWAAMGALAVLQGSQLQINIDRALQRTVGTTIGAALAWVMLNQQPSVWVLIGALVALQILTEMVIGAN